MASADIGYRRTFYKPTIIYGLVCPITNELRYVGKTGSGLRRRYDSHLTDARSGSIRPCQIWIGSLLAKGVRPEIFEIQACREGEDWEEAERFWIAYFRFIGCRLLNVSLGGGGGSLGYRASQEEKLRRSAALMGRTVSEETRRKIGASNAGRVHSAETREKNRLGKLGEKSPTARLKATDIPVVRALRKAGYSGSQVAAVFGIRKQTVDAVFKGESWAHVPDSPVDVSGISVPPIRRLRGSENGTAKLNEDAVRDIRRRLAGRRGKRETGRALAAEYGVSASIISAVRKRQTWKHVD